VELMPKMISTTPPVRRARETSLVIRVFRLVRLFAA
jgi:hypothetical protein